MSSINLSQPLSLDKQPSFFNSESLQNIEETEMDINTTVDQPQINNQKMQIEEENQKEDQQDLILNQLDFTIVEQIQIYSNKPFDWYSSIFNQSQNLPMGNYSEFSDLKKIRTKLEQTLRYYKFEKILQSQPYRKTGVQQINERNLIQEFNQVQIVEAFVSVFKQFESNKNLCFQYVDNKMKTKYSNFSILFKWVKIVKKTDENSEQYEYNHFFNQNFNKTQDNNKNITFVPIAIITSIRKQTSKKLQQYGIDYCDLKQTLNDADDKQEHINHMTFGDNIKNGYEVLLVKDKFINNLWMRILNEKLENNGSNSTSIFEIIASFDFQNSQVVYPKQYFCGTISFNDMSQYSQLFEEEKLQQQKNQQEQTRNKQNFKNFKIFQPIQENLKNTIYSLKLFGNIPQFIVRNFAEILDEIGIKAQFQVDRIEISQMFSTVVINHLLNKYEENCQSVLETGTDNNQNYNVSQLLSQQSQQ